MSTFGVETAPLDGGIDAPDLSPYPECRDPVLGQIGSTPIVPRSENVYCKLETQNPTGSMKDRVALGLISKMRANGTIDDGPVIEASSGNTAGAVSLVCSRLDLECRVTFPEGTSGQKTGYMRAFGAETRACPDVPSDHEDHYVNRAAALAERTGGTFLNQYENELNPQVHAEWTGEEIVRQCGERITHVVAPMSTGGTLSGVASRLTAEHPSVEIVGVDGEDSNISAAFYDEAPGPYDVDVEGLGKSEKLPTMWFDHVDEVETVSDEAAFERARAAARDGFLVGPSSAAALEAADEYAANDDNAVLTVVCDGGEQYFDELTP